MIGMDAATYLVGVCMGLVWWLAASTVGAWVLVVFTAVGVAAYCCRRLGARGDTWARR